MQIVRLEHLADALAPAALALALGKIADMADTLELPIDGGASEGTLEVRRERAGEGGLDKGDSSEEGNASCTRCSRPCMWRGTAQGCHRMMPWAAQIGGDPSPRVQDEDSAIDATTSS